MVKNQLVFLALLFSPPQNKNKLPQQDTPRAAFPLSIKVALVWGGAGRFSPLRQQGAPSFHLCAAIACPLTHKNPLRRAAIYSSPVRCAPKGAAVRPTGRSNPPRQDTNPEQPTNGKLIFFCEKHQKKLICTSDLRSTNFVASGSRCSLTTPAPKTHAKTQSSFVMVFAKPFPTPPKPATITAQKIPLMIFFNYASLCKNDKFKKIKRGNNAVGTSASMVLVSCNE